MSAANHLPTYQYCYSNQDIVAKDTRSLSSQVALHTAGCRQGWYKRTIELIPTCQGHWRVSNPQPGLLQGNAPCKHPVLGDSSRLGSISEAAKLFRPLESRVQIGAPIRYLWSQVPPKYRYVVSIRHVHVRLRAEADPVAVISSPSSCS